VVRIQVKIKREARKERRERGWVGGGIKKAELLGFR
jgi:hypothetical protein